MSASTHVPALVPSVALPLPARAFAPPSFDYVYAGELAFVWRSARRLGVREAAVEDVVQEIFVVVHRQLPEFEGRSSLKTWLFGITLRVVRDHLRSARRKATCGDEELASVRDHRPGPSDHAERSEAVRLLHALLDELDDARREVFVMAELEQMTVPEIAEVLGLNVNTTYARLRLARQEVEQALARHRARDGWRFR